MSSTSIHNPVRAIQAQRRTRCGASPARLIVASNTKQVTLLDYGAGNVCSVRNAIKKLGYSIRDVQSPQDILAADKLIFPGVGSIGQAAAVLKDKGYAEPLKEYILSDRPFFGICLGLQLLFEGSEESGGCEGLGIIPGMVARFDASHGLPIPHIGWNTLDLNHPNPVLSANTHDDARRVYFVHSFRAMPSDANTDWVAATSSYGDRFVAAVNRGNVYATQFHPEKSGDAGLSILGAFLGDDERTSSNATASTSTTSTNHVTAPRGLAKRVIACLDVRANDAGDLVVTKGDQYDVRESDADGGGGDVRNLGKPVDLATRYFEQGADEVTFLNITGFRDFPLGDLPMLEVLRRTSEGVFVPLTVGGGIRDFVDGNGQQYSALQVAGEYFRSGADKVSIGSDAVDAAERYYADGKVGRGDSSIEQISSVYGAQAVVVSIDPRRVWVADPAACPQETVESASTGPNGERYCWWQCTVKGGREGRPLGAVELARAVEALGAGEILLNCIDCDGVGNGFDLELVEAVSSAVTIPVIASSGAGAPVHFSDVFARTKASAALAAGIFHREEVAISEVKEHMAAQGIPTRL